MRTGRARDLVRASRWLILLAVGVVMGTIASAYVVGRPTQGPNASGAPDFYVAAPGTLSRTLQLSGTAEWPAIGQLHIPAGGIVTEVVAASGIVRPGDVLLRIDERPLVLVPGEIPAFRALTVGTTGRDVATLQRFLAGLDLEVDEQLDQYTETTADAVRRWQDALGIPATGEVELGDILIAAPSSLNAPLRWTDQVALGATLAPATSILEQLEVAPVLTIDFGGEPPTQLEAGVVGYVTFPGGAARKASLSQFRYSAGRVWATLEPPSGQLCNPAECLELVSPEGTTPIDVEFVLVPETTGVLVPVAALRSDASGRAFVELKDGTRRFVTITVASGGSAIVDGIEPGEAITLP